MAADRYTGRKRDFRRLALPRLESDENDSAAQGRTNGSSSELGAPAEHALGEGREVRVVRGAEVQRNHDSGVAPAGHEDDGRGAIRGPLVAIERPAAELVRAEPEAVEVPDRLLHLGDEPGGQQPAG